MLNTKITTIEEQLKTVLGETALEKLGKESGFIRRRRTITASMFVGSLLHSLGTRKVETIADLHRDFNSDNGLFVNYKPYFEKLDSPGFPELMRILFERMMSEMSLRILSPLKEGPFGAFTDIALHDGSSFALHDDLRKEFPGRFKTISPAAVELHATMSLFRDNLTTVTITADSECERHYAPDPKDLRRKLFMGDRGFDDRCYMKAIEQNRGSFLIRVRSIMKPVVTRIYRLSSKYRKLEGKRLDEVLKRIPKSKLLDLDVCWVNYYGEPDCSFRMVLKYNRSEKSWMRLMTNLPRKLFSAKSVLNAYHLRWQIELYFKELKSYANLHRFCTSKATIAEGLFWASLCVAFLKRYLAHACQHVLPGRDISTRRVAMCGHSFLGSFFHSMRRRFRGLRDALVEAFLFLFNNAVRSNPRRERKKGRLAFGLLPVNGAV